MTTTQGEHAPEALRPEMLDDLIETFATAGLGRHNLMRVELPRHQWAQLAVALSRLHTQVAAIMAGNREEMAHELFAAAQLAPGEGIEDAVSRIAAALTAAPAPTPAAQADSQPTPVQDYPPLPECQGKIFDDGYWIQNKLGPKHCVMGGAKVWLESQVHKAIDADRAARAPTDSVLEDAAQKNVCTDCTNADSWGLPDKPCCRSCVGSSNWQPLNRSSVHPNAARKQGGTHDNH